MKAEPVSKAASRGASVAKTGLSDRGRAWWQHHKTSASQSFARLLGAPMQTLMTAMVVAIALALPATLYALLDNVYRLGDQWDSSPKLSVYLHLRTQPNAVEALQEKLLTMPEVAAVTFISASDALRQFQAQSGFGAALDVLDENPLPDTFILTPAAAYVGPEALQRLVERITSERIVDAVEMDLEWVKKLKAMMALGQKVVLGLAVLLGLGVLLAIGNTIRLEIENRREEIVVVKLVGGTNGFVRRPLLYTGAWYGVLGAALGCVLVTIAIASLGAAVSDLAATYQSDFSLQGLGIEGFAALLGMGSALGLFGAWAAVARHLSAIEPS